MPTTSNTRKATRRGALSQAPAGIRRGRRPWHARTLFAREPGDLRSDRRCAYRPTGPHREGEEPKPMMHGLEKSDLAIVATKAGTRPGARRGAGGAKGGDRGEHGPSTHAPDAEPGERVTGAGPCTASCKAAEEGEVHRADAPCHRRSAAGAFQALERRRRRGGWPDMAGVRGKPGANLQDLHDRVHRGSYRAKPVRRRFIPKPEGRQRPLGVTALEDKIVQCAVVRFSTRSTRRISSGSRMGSGQGAVSTMRSMPFGGINAMRVNWILDADIRSFFDRIDRMWLLRFRGIGSVTSASSALCEVAQGGRSG